MTDYRERPPHPRLAPWVRCIWRLQTPPASGGAAGGAVEAILPDGCVEWIFHLGPPFWRLDDSGRAERQARSLFAGLSTRVVRLVPAAGAQVIGVRFEPGGAAPFVAPPLDSFTDRIVPLAELEDRSLRALADDLEACPPAARFSRLEAVLLERLARARRADPRIPRAAARLAAGGVTVDTVARACGVGPRQLQRVFHATVGVGPKRLARIGRFQRAAKLLCRGELPSVQAAQSAGYADQAHFVREFRDFTGTTPERYRRQEHALADAFLHGG